MEAGGVDGGPGPSNFDFSKTTDYKGFVQRDLNACLIAFSTVFIGLRLYVRAFMTKGLGLDDLMSAIAYVCADDFFPPCGGRVVVSEMVKYDSS